MLTARNARLRLCARNDLKSESALHSWCALMPAIAQPPEFCECKATRVAIQHGVAAFACGTLLRFEDGAVERGEDCRIVVCRVVLKLS